MGGVAFIQIHPDILCTCLLCSRWHWSHNVEAPYLTCQGKQKKMPSKFSNVVHGGPPPPPHSPWTICSASLPIENVTMKPGSHQDRSIHAEWDRDPSFIPPGSQFYPTGISFIPPGSRWEPGEPLGSRQNFWLDANRDPAKIPGLFSKRQGRGNN
jgi:hypothetical protein